MKPRSARIHLIDLLLVTALIGGVLTLSTPAGEQRVTPDFSTTPQHEQALDEMNAVGLGMVSWLIDQVSRQIESQARPQIIASLCGSFDVATLPIITQSDLETLLVPNYLTAVPEFDPWGEG